MCKRICMQYNRRLIERWLHDMPELLGIWLLSEKRKRSWNENLLRWLDFRVSCNCGTYKRTHPRSHFKLSEKEPTTELRVTSGLKRRKCVKPLKRIRPQKKTHLGQREEDYHTTSYNAHDDCVGLSGAYLINK